jgi:diguanylate cyclase (GGDEF)-like protein
MTTDQALPPKPAPSAAEAPARGIESPQTHTGVQSEEDKQVRDRAPYEALRQACASGRASVAELSFSSGDGVGFVGELKLAALPADTDDPSECRLLAVVIDLTERWGGEAELACERQLLREKSEELDRYFAYSRDLLCIVDLENRFVRLNPEWKCVLDDPTAEVRGEIGVENLQGQGATFRFSGRLQPGPGEKGFAHPVDLDEAKMQRRDPAMASARASGPRKRTIPPRFDGALILVAEDQALNQEVVRRLLERTGARVTLANNGAEAVNMVEACAFDLVLMDLEMPVMDGFEATRVIHERHPYLPVIAFSAAVMEEDLERARAAGVSGYLAKPIDTGALYRTLSNWIEPRETPASSAEGPRPGKPASPLPATLDGFDLDLGRQHADGDDAFYLTLLEGFRTELSGGLADVVERLGTGDDSATVRRILHTLKGLAGTVGAVRLSSIAAEIDRALNRGLPVGSAMRLELKASLEQVQAQLARLRWPALEGQDSMAIAVTGDPPRNASESGGSKVPAPIWPHSRRPHVLIVDDQPIQIQAMRRIFQDDCEVFTATDGEQALAHCRRATPDLILLDVIMPGMDGLAVCRALKQHGATADIPILFVTAQTDALDQTQALEAGGVDFISKPVNPAIVRARVRTQLTLKAQSDLLRDMAYLDGLTGIANRRAFEERLRTEWRRAQRDGTPLAAILLDVDHFKRYNDRHGHQEGDACLRAVAEALIRVTSRGHDLVARYGGEEFVCLLPGCDMPAAVRRAECLRVAVEDLEIPHLDSPVDNHVTVSIGAAALMADDGERPERLLEMADEQLYRAKRAGRNRVEPGAAG